MTSVFAVFPGAERVCRACALRFNTAACPDCDAAPDHDRCDGHGRAWLRDRRRGQIESPHAARTAPVVISNPPGVASSPFAALGALGLAAAANALAWIATASPLVAVVAGTAAGVTGAVGISMARRGPRARSGVCVLDAGGVAVLEAPDTALRGVLCTPGRPRGATRWALRGRVLDVTVADLVGPPMTLRTADGEEYALVTEGATVVVEGPARLRTPTQIRVGRHLHALGWLQGSSREQLLAVALHDGLEVEVRGSFEDPSNRPLATAFRSAPRVLTVRPSRGVMWVRAIEG